MNINESQAVFLKQLYSAELEHERVTTRKVIAAVPESGKDYRPDPKAHTAFELAWHLVQSELWFLDGIAKGEFASGAKERPSSVTSIAEVLRFDTEQYPAAWSKVQSLEDRKLIEPIDMFGMVTLPRVSFLSIMLKHSVHHRAQLGTYLRPMGSKVPAIYGNSADSK